MKVQILDIDVDPLTKMGVAAQVCYKSEGDPIKVAKSCLKSGHHRVAEFSDLTLMIEASAGLMREVYTHIAGTSRLQGSTRYIDFENFEYVTPKTIDSNEEASGIYGAAMEDMRTSYGMLQDLGIPKQDARNLLPLGHNSQVVIKINVRALMHMAELRTCSRAHWEFQQLMKMIIDQVKEISEQWEYIADNYLITKCQTLGYCPEINGCGRMKPKDEVITDENIIQKKIAHWMRTFGQAVNSEPVGPNDLKEDQKKLMYNLVAEELEELGQAIKDNDQIEIADALGDLVWVTIWGLNLMGLDMDILLEEMYRSNMSKFWPDGTIHRRLEDNKIIKPDIYSPPNIKGALERMKRVDANL